jgi:phosphatidylinositol alpha-1,6-mannosyltransferase
LRLLVITNDFPPTVGGIENIVFSITSRWDSNHVVVLTRYAEGGSEFDRNLSFDVHREPVGTLLPTPGLLKRARKIVAERSIDMIWFPTPLPAGLLGPRLSRWAGVPFVVSIMGADFMLMSSIPFVRSQARKVLQRSAAVLPLSGFLAEEVQRLVRNHPRIEVVPPGVDTELFRPADGRAPREEILFISRVVARKGALTLIRSLPEIQRRHASALLRFVGGGPKNYVSRLQTIAKGLGVDGSVIFEGSQPWGRLPIYYRDADVFCVPTQSRFGGREIEGFGMVYIEAAACAVPVVAGNTGGTHDALVDGETGYIVDGSNPTSVARAVGELLGDRDKAAAFGLAGRQRAVEEFDWAVVTARFRSVLETAHS